MSSPAAHPPTTSLMPDGGTYFSGDLTAVWNGVVANDSDNGGAEHVAVRLARVRSSLCVFWWVPKACELSNLWWQ